MTIHDLQQHDLEHMTDAELLTLQQLLYERLILIEQQTSTEYLDVISRLTAFRKEYAERQSSEHLSPETGELLASLYLGFQGNVYCLKVFKQHLWIEQLGAGNMSFDKYAVDASDARQVYNPDTGLWDFDVLTCLIKQYRPRADRA
jgi:hypothetical protein